MFSWKDYAFTVGMPHMVPGRLSEVELLKWLGAWQWDSIAEMLDTPSAEITNENGERLYASFVNIELDLRARHSLASFTEGSSMHLRNGTRLYAGTFVEGLYLLDDKPLPEGCEGSVQSTEDLTVGELPWVSMNNCFVAPFGGENDRLKVHAPRGLDEDQGEAGRSIAQTDERPQGLVEHAQVQSSGLIEAAWDDEDFVPLETLDAEPIPYFISPESDLNGAGLLYFARYVAMMDHGERELLMDGLEQPLSHQFVSCLATTQRRLFYFANAQPWDAVDVRVTPFVRDCGSSGETPSARHRVPLEFMFRIDLHRDSDQMLMASSLVRKALVIPAHRKALLAEAERFLAGCLEED